MPAPNSLVLDLHFSTIKRKDKWEYRSDQFNTGGGIDATQVVRGWEAVLFLVDGTTIL